VETEQIILKLKESLKKDYGDYGRTNYVIGKLENKAPLPKSDYLYIDRMISLCTPVIEETKSKENSAVILLGDLIKCYQCDSEIELYNKSIRKNNFWFHEKCFEKIPITKSIHSEEIKSKENSAVILLDDLIKCYHCNLQIGLDNKSIIKKKKRL
jgi:hypothetical protein